MLGLVKVALQSLGVGRLQVLSSRWLDVDEATVLWAEADRWGGRLSIVDAVLSGSFHCCGGRGRGSCEEGTRGRQGGKREWVVAEMEMIECLRCNRMRGIVVKAKHKI